MAKKGKNKGLSGWDNDSDGASVPAPFDLSIKGSDVILRSSPDRVDFRVHKQILSLASSIFEDMFALPQPAQDSSSDVESGPGPDWQDGLPVVHVTEDSDTLKRLLLLVYPYPDPPLETVDQVGRAYEARRKYEIRAGDTAIDTALSALIKSDPVSVFAIAGHAGDVPLAKLAAVATLALRVRDLRSPQLATIPASTFRALLDYRFRCEDTVSELATPKGFRSPNKAWTHIISSLPYSSSGEPCTRQRRPDEDRDEWLSGWWMEFLEAVRAKLREYPHRTTLSMIDTEQFLAKADNCNRCRPKARTDFAQALRDLGKLIDKTIAQMPLDI